MLDALEHSLGPAWPAVWTLVKIVAIVVPLMLCVAYLTLAERKVIGYMQVRIGPNRVGPLGLLQPIADVLKLLFKEIIIPSGANKFLFVLAPVMAIMPALGGLGGGALRLGLVLADINAGLLYVLAITSMGVYGVIIAGWASNSKYAFLGSLRSAAQIVAYEIAMGFALVARADGERQPEPGRHRRGAAVGAGGCCRWNWIPLFPLFLVYLISGVAETNRAPFDVAEGESEIVAGFHVEYSGMAFAMFFLAEYANMILVSTLCCDDVPGRLAVAAAVPAGRLPVAARQGRLRAVPVPLVPRHLPALSLRPDHAAGLEGVHPDHAGLAGGDRRLDADAVVAVGAAT